jgi:hypothetical protein
MNWFEIAILAVFVSLTTLLVWINRWWAVREGVTANRRWYAEACLKWAATVADVAFVVVTLTLSIESVILYRFLSIAAIALVLSAIWSIGRWLPRQSKEQRLVATVCLWFTFDISWVFAHFGNMLSPTEPHAMAIVCLLTFYALNLLAIWVPARKMVEPIYQNDSCVRL